MSCYLTTCVWDRPGVEVVCPFHPQWSPWSGPMPIAAARRPVVSGAVRMLVGRLMRECIEHNKDYHWITDPAVILQAEAFLRTP